MTQELAAPSGFYVVAGPPADLDEVVDLMRLVEAHTAGSSVVTHSFVNMLIHTPELDAHRDILQIRSAATDSLVAFGRFHDSESHVESTTSCWVHPENERQGLGSTILRWSQDRSRLQVSLAPFGTRVTNRCQISDSNRHAAELLAEFGYTVDRHDIEMRLDFDEPIVPTQHPADVAIRLMSGAQDIPVIEEVVTAAFRDHYGWIESSREDRLARWRNYRKMDEWDDSLVWIAEMSHGAVAVIVCLRSHGSQTDVGYVGSIGVVRSSRGKGVARSLLTVAFAEYQRRGLRSVALHVDADSLTGATKLYESVGMVPDRIETAYLVELRPGKDLVVR